MAPKKGWKHSFESRIKMSIFQRGRKHPQEVKDKIGKSHLGHHRKHSEETKKKISQSLIGNKYAKGMKHSEETRKKMSNDRTSAGASNWKGGISYGKYSPNFNFKLKEEIRKRDGFKCQLGICKQHQRINERLCVHHIDYNKKNCSPDNLISLCRYCHSRVGTGKESWSKLFNAFITKESYVN